MENIHSQSREVLARTKTKSGRFADFLTNSFGTIAFLILNAVFFLVWILLNSSLIPGVHAFDPFPYGLLTMAVSLEAIFLSIIVLVSQNRAGKLADLREELDLKINIQAENEITRLIIMVDEIHDHLGLNPEDDDELKAMKIKTNIEMMEKDLEKGKNN
ncbi:MAG: DUF1003 domain-containing protein [Candidatus Magasanikbacteria bacterium]|nr:DUF1003 domain-containing protein [Candidatus Magasanikbacteria bacterium]